MRITSDRPPQPMTAALRIGGAAALALAVMLGISVLVGPAATHDELQSGSELTVAGKGR